MIALPRWFPVALLAAAVLSLLLLLWWVFWGQPYGVADAFAVWVTVTDHQKSCFSELGSARRDR